MEENKINLMNQFEKWCWRISASLAWLWIINAIVIKLELTSKSFISNYALFAITLPIILSLQRPFRILLYICYLIAFIPISIWISLKTMFAGLLLAGKVFGIAAKTLSVVTSFWFSVFLFILVIPLHLLTITHPESHSIPKGIAHIVVATLLVLSASKWVYNPLNPMRFLKEKLVRLVEKIWGLYERSARQAILSGDVDKIRKEYKSHRDSKEKLENAIFKDKITFPCYTAKKTTVILLIGTLFLLFACIAFGYGACIESFNHSLEKSEYPISFLTANKLIFSSLPTTASYMDCVFHSFTIMTTIQGFSTLDTGFLARIIIVLEISTTILLLTIMTAVFFGVIGFENDFNILDTRAILTEIQRRQQSLIDDLDDARAGIMNRPLLENPQSEQS